MNVRRNDYSKATKLKEIYFLGEYDPNSWNVFTDKLKKDGILGRDSAADDILEQARIFIEAKIKKTD